MPRAVSLLAAHRGQQPHTVLAARAARAQVRRDARIPLFGWGAGSCQLRVDVQHLHGLGASHVARVSPQEVIQFRPAVHELLAQSSSLYPLATRDARTLCRSSNSVW